MFDRLLEFGTNHIGEICLALLFMMFAVAVFLVVFGNLSREYSQRAQEPRSESSKEKVT